MKTFTRHYQKSTMINSWLFMVYSCSTGPAEVIFDGTQVACAPDGISSDQQKIIN
jgi:hypothetical protein